MSGDMKRTPGGQFVRGQSGNAAGARSRRRRELLTPDDVHGIILNVAASEVKMTIGDRVETVNMLTRNVMALASGSGNRAASKDFIELAASAAWHFRRENERQERKAIEDARRLERRY